MKSISRFLVPSFSPLLAVGAIAALASACTVSPASDASASDAGPNGNAPDAAQPAFPFAPSNVSSLSSHDLSLLSDAQITGDCDVDTDNASALAFGCGNAVPVVWNETQSDGSVLTVFAFQSLSIAQTAHVRVTGSHGAVFLAFGDMNIEGALLANARGDKPGPGGFSADTLFSKGGGPGAGPAGVDNGGGPAPGTGYVAGIAAGGASFCGVGGTGSQEGDTAGALTVMPGAAAPAYGTPMLVPLVAGSSGGVGGLGPGGSGGGAIELVAGGTLTLGALAVVNASGGGGNHSGATNDHEEASGAGSGGAILVEATAAIIQGTLAANGGGGGGKDADGQDGSADANAALGGTDNAAAEGGSGSSASNVAGGAGTKAADSSAGGGGGGAGRIRINTASGAANVSGVVSPALTTSCASQGTIAPAADK